MQFAAATFPVVLAWLLSLQVQPLQASTPDTVPLHNLQADNSEKLASLFAQHNYTWPPSEQIPALAVVKLPPDLASISIPQKKALFFRALLPLVLAENRVIREQRQWLTALNVKSGQVTSVERERLLQLAEEYGLSDKIDRAALTQELLKRVDELPPALVLAQAANESGWGTSRFALEANNLFGEWTFKPEHGVAPRIRREGSRHYIRRFHDLRHSVRSYLNNINSSRAYRTLRAMRAAMRTRGEPLDALALASGLHHYSVRGEAYINEIRTMITSNRLNELGPLRLARLSTDD